MIVEIVKWTRLPIVYSVTVNKLFKALLMFSVVGFHGKGKDKGKIHPTEDQRGSKGTALLFIKPRR